MTEQEWRSTYRPGPLLSVHDPDVRRAGNQYIWTKVQGDEGTYAVPGWHFVNREGYYLCEVPFAEGFFAEVEL